MEIRDPQEGLFIVCILLTERIQSVCEYNHLFVFTVMMEECTVVLFQ